MIRKTLVLCLALATAPAFAAPGDQNTPRDRRAAQMERLTEVLQLRPDQVAPVESILSEQRQARKENRQRDSEQRQAHRQQTLDRLSAVLDAEQLARFDGFSQGARMGYGKKGMRGNCGGPGSQAGTTR